MVDLTVYTDKDFTPDNALRQIFARQKLPSKLCLVIANAGLLSVDNMAVLGDNLKDMKDMFKDIIGDESKLGGTDPEISLAYNKIAAVWRNCMVLADHFATKRARMEEDPSKVPEIAQEDHSEFRAKCFDGSS